MERNKGGAALLPFAAAEAQPLVQAAMTAQPCHINPTQSGKICNGIEGLTLKYAAKITSELSKDHICMMLGLFSFPHELNCRGNLKQGGLSQDSFRLTRRAANSCGISAHCRPVTRIDAALPALPRH